MKKIFSILILFFFWNSYVAADSVVCKFSWTVNELGGYATFKFVNKSTSSQVARINSVTIKTKNSDKMYTKNFKPFIYVKPYTKKEIIVRNSELLWDLAGKASIGCYPITLATYEMETKKNTGSKTNNNKKSNSKKLLEKIFGD
tara:strand:+ start:204 stop:635 length:432 start_codon:yes stop_codon:yes gene_type:complete